MIPQRIEELNGWIYNDIANGAYKAGFAKSQVFLLFVICCVRVPSQRSAEAAATSTAAVAPGDCAACAVSEAHSTGPSTA